MVGGTDKALPQCQLGYGLFYRIDRIELISQPLKLKTWRLLYSSKEQVPVESLCVPGSRPSRWRQQRTLGSVFARGVPQPQPGLGEVRQDPVSNMGPDTHL